MKYIISGTDIKQVDKYSIENIGIPSLVLMERAALAVAEQVEELANPHSKVFIVANVGNNGGDGVAAGRILLNRGLSTCLFIVGNPKNGTKDFQRQIEIYSNIGGDIVYLEENNLQLITTASHNDIIVDSLFGVGLSREVSGLYADVIEQINYSKAKIVAIDIPSGIDGNNGQVRGVAVKADYTVTFNTNRTGNVLYPGQDFAGIVIVKDIGFPQSAFDQVKCYYNLEDSDISTLPKRVNNSNKGTYGKVLVVAGSDEMTGAAYMCTLAAMRMGAGMVKLFTTPKCGQTVRSMLPEVMVTTCPTENQDFVKQFEDAIKWCDVIVAGPGMGISSYTTEMIKRVLLSNKLAVIDADGINVISKSSELKKFLNSNVILTPHVGEMSRLSKMTIDNIKCNLIHTCEEAALHFGVTIVLKDARSIISNGDTTYINTTGNSGMSTAGSGDVLTGILSAVIASARATMNKSEDFVRYCALADMIHGMAGDIAATKHTKTGLIATDIIDELQVILEKAEAE